MIREEAPSSVLNPEGSFQNGSSTLMLAHGNLKMRHWLDIQFLRHSTGFEAMECPDQSP
jgi:hypothetical protein